MHIAQVDAPLLELLTKLYPESSKTTLRAWIKEGRVKVDHITIKRADQQVSKNQTIQVSSRRFFTREPFPILYEDKHIVVVDKLAGMLSVATAFEKDKTIHALLKKRYRPHPVYVVHRLDQETSGVILFALSEEAYQGMKSLFQAHELERIYCGIVEGRVTPQEGSWHSYLHEDRSYRVHASQDPHAGALAITHYRVVRSSYKFSLLEFKLETGRKNQIRVHCQAAAHPLVGDEKYGAVLDPLHRLCLHACTLAFTHPITGQQMRFDSPVPETFQQLV